MKVLLTGLSDASAHVIETLATTLMPGATVCRHTQGQAFGGSLRGGFGPKDICIVDLNGLGLAQWSRTRQEQLQDHMLGPCKALLLAPGGSGGGWVGAFKPLAGKNRLVLQKPLSAAALRDALATLRDAVHAPLTPLTPSGQAASTAATGGLTESAWEQLRDACPAVGANPYLNLGAGLAVKGTPHEFRIGSHSGGVLHPAEGWVASNISTGMRERLLRHPAMQSIIEITALDSSQARMRAERLFGRRQDGRRPLDAFLWALAYHTLADEPLPLAGDLHFQLQQFPNFTRLPAAPDLFIQLALLSQRGPQRLSSLQRTFAQHDPALVVLFAACAVLSGCATVLPAASASPTFTLPAAPRKPAPPRSFLRSLLGKLF